MQKALGHADLSTTMIYTHIVDEELGGLLSSFGGVETGKMINNGLIERGVRFIGSGAEGIVLVEK